MISYIYRFKKIDDAFSSNFGQDVSFYARCSGRVNLIGKQIFVLMGQKGFTLSALHLK